MNIRAILLLLVLIFIAIFAAANWGVFMTPTALSLLVTTIEAPFGLVMLGLTVLLAIVAIVYAAHLKTTMLIESRNNARDMQALRKLAEQAEASRLTDVLNRLEGVEQKVCTAVEQSGNTLAAYIGELEDRLQRDGGKSASSNTL